MTRRLLVLAALTLAATTSVAYAATLTVSSWHLWAGSQTLTKATCTVTGAQTDTYVDQNAATTSFGAAATLNLLPSGDAPKEKWVFVQFDLSSCAIPATGGADSATLSLYYDERPDHELQLRRDARHERVGGHADLEPGAVAQLRRVADDVCRRRHDEGVRISFPVTVDVDSFIKGGSNFGWRISRHRQRPERGQRPCDSSRPPTPARTSRR